MSKSVLPADSNAVNTIIDAAERGRLVCIIGTGVSLSLTQNKFSALSWKGLIERGFQHGLEKGAITDTQLNAWRQQLESTDLDDLLAAAEFVTRKLDGPGGVLYGRWLRSELSAVKPTNASLQVALKALKKHNVRIATLNYDTLLEAATKSKSITLSDQSDIVSWMRGENRDILHLHGIWSAPATCVLGIRDYEKTLSDETRLTVQRSLASFDTLLFIGCGDTFADPNFTSLIAWLKQVWGAASSPHYALVKASDVSSRHADPAWKGFVEPLSYGDSYDKLPEFLLKKCKFELRPKSTRAVAATNSKGRAQQHGIVLDAYKHYLIRDAGEMTIEGVRADMETAQRRFQIERLFVPLSLLPSPPEISLKDPDRQKKIAKWQEENSNPVSFGKAFSKVRKIALLALPGGGKSLLLKRLAVAYSDEVRRRQGGDELPDERLLPVLIKCREWRDHIKKPIIEIIKSLPMITGQAGLSGIEEAILPSLYNGDVLLLVDGLDEVHNDADRLSFVENLERFLVEFPKIRLIVTSREAGFSLVAPNLMRFCERWRIAPLSPSSIKQLSRYWHTLMAGPGAETSAEAENLANQLISSRSLARLAENPLLLTMLLVVKHGAGRLPPDRVSLYERAVEVLLDTWNIKGHDPLSPREAVPQLASVAFQLTRQGAQTATEKEILALLEDARDNIQQVKRYAKGAPHEFLRRVEVRSSLLVEGGHKQEGTALVPFYQFRHLTFQEYLTAVAIVEGHYANYSREHTLIDPLGSDLLSDKWKEVLPMASVLAKKRADVLFDALIKRAEPDVDRLLKLNQIEARDSALDSMPAPASRLLDCLLEEAEISASVLADAIRVIVLFASRDRAQRLEGLMRGPFADEVFDQTMKIYVPMMWPRACWMIGTMRRVSLKGRSIRYWLYEASAEVDRLLKSAVLQDRVLGGFICTNLGVRHLTADHPMPSIEADKTVLEDGYKAIQSRLPVLEGLAFSNDRAVSIPAIWAISQYVSGKGGARWFTGARLDKLLRVFFADLDGEIYSPAFMIFEELSRFPNIDWIAVLDADKRSKLEGILNGFRNVLSGNKKDRDGIRQELLISCLVVAAFSRDVFDPDDLSKLVTDTAEMSRTSSLLSVITDDRKQNLLRLINKRRSRA